MYENVWYAKTVFTFRYAKKFHGYAMRHRRSMRVDVGVPYTGLMIDAMISYTDSKIETGRNSLRTKIIINMDLKIPYTDSEIETGRNSLRIKRIIDMDLMISHIV